MPQSEVVRPIIRRRDDLPIVTVRSNDQLTKKDFTTDFELGGFLVGQSCAWHPAGEECGEHSHRGLVETFVVIQGAGVITVDGVEHNVVVGDYVAVPAGVRHNLRGTSADVKFGVLCTTVAIQDRDVDPTPWVK